MSSFSRQHYEKIAAVIKAAYEAQAKQSGDVPGYDLGIKDITLGLAKIFQEDNQRFAASRFFDAAGWVSYVPGDKQ